MLLTKFFSFFDFCCNQMVLFVECVCNMCRMIVGCFENNEEI